MQLSIELEILHRGNALSHMGARFGHLFPPSLHDEGSVGRYS
jgi:hypothetical protein